MHLAHVMQQLGNAPLAHGAAMTALGIQERPYHAAVQAMCWGDAPARIAQEGSERLPRGSFPAGSCAA